MKLVASKAPIEIKKITEYKYAPLRRIFKKTNLKCRVLAGHPFPLSAKKRGFSFPSVKIVELSTEIGRCFYVIQNAGRTFSACEVRKINENTSEGVMVYERK